MINSLTTEDTEFTEKVNSIDAYVVGQIQLEAAIDHYNTGSYICAITLARAAEEYLGKLLVYSTGKKSAKDELQNRILQKYGEKPTSLNDIANWLKHFDEDFCEKTHYIRLDSIQLIFRALNNFVSLGIPLTSKMLQFSENHTQNNLDIIINEANPSVNSVPSVVKNSNTKNSDDNLNFITGKIIDCAINVHKQLGAGLLESVYQYAMAYTLAQEGLKFEKEKSIPIVFNNHDLGIGYRADFIIEDRIILEIKSVEKLSPNHNAQILNYMRLGHFKLGLLMNFNETLLKNGLRRFKI